MFKQKRKRNFSEYLRQLFYPRGGWKRASYYLWYRLRRIPDTPEKIGRGVFAGVWACFTPLFGFHVLVAAVLAFLLRGNILAAVLATLVGNPLTFPFIAALSISIGNQILGYEFVSGIDSKSTFILFQMLFKDIWLNTFALFTEREADWSSFPEIYHGVFLPYLVGGQIPGIVSGFAAAWLCKSVIHAYQKRRRAKAARKHAERRGMSSSSLKSSLIPKSRLKKRTEKLD
ncbi:MAG: DUF2062 domain-containing protein [Albidovulum sp.]|nr:DUF2062 domain-containing protein [Albidovulum sp.]MDE0531922.1 DUF2062 domain-containing protein [Albidovulum sp.]